MSMRQCACATCPCDHMGSRRDKRWTQHTLSLLPTWRAPNCTYTPVSYLRLCHTHCFITLEVLVEYCSTSWCTAGFAPLDRCSWVSLTCSCVERQKRVAAGSQHVRVLRCAVYRQCQHQPGLVPWAHCKHHSFSMCECVATAVHTQLVGGGVLLLLSHCNNMCVSSSYAVSRIAKECACRQRTCHVSVGSCRCLVCVP